MISLSLLLLSSVYILDEGSKHSIVANPIVLSVELKVLMFQEQMTTNIRWNLIQRLSIEESTTKHCMLIQNKLTKETMNREVTKTTCSKRERNRGKIKRHQNTNYIIQEWTKNGNIILQTSYRVGYILTKLGQLPFMLFTKIAYTSLYKRLMWIHPLDDCVRQGRRKREKQHKDRACVSI